MPKIILSVNDVSKNFAVRVLDKIQFDLRLGEIHGLIGANGAGKSTLCKIISGLLLPDSGEMKLNGVLYRPKNRNDSEQSGIQIVHQELSLVDTLTVSENLFLNRLPTRFGCLNKTSLYRKTKSILNKFGLKDINPDSLVGSLGIGQKQLVQIAVSLSRDCKVLILDEPTSSLNQRETEQLFCWLQSLKLQGIGIIFISHRIPDIKTLTDRVTVLRDGQSITACDTKDVCSKSILSYVAGESTARVTKKPFQSYCSHEPGIRLSHLEVQNGIQDISFTAYRGERVGITGLVGSGRTQLLHAIFGSTKTKRGSIQIGASEPTTCFTHPKDALRSGIGMVTEDRKQTGLMMSLDVKTNLTFASLKSRFSSNGLIHETEEQKESSKLRKDTHLKCNNLQQPVKTLSGGNQQKIALGKWLACDVKILLLDEPTRGIDAVARQNIYTKMEDLAKQKKTIVMVSSDLDELLDNCDRILVISQGRLTASFTRPDWSSDRITSACFTDQVDN
jgi:ribose transport system ATP-binding protein